MPSQTAAYPRKPVDYWLFGGALCLLVIGLLMVLDSSYIEQLDRGNHDAFFQLKRQLGGAFMGIAALAAVWAYGYWRLSRLAVPLMIFGLVLLIAVYFPPFRHVEKGAARWIKVGFMFQPSEVAKLFLLIYVAKLLSRPVPKSFNSLSALVNWVGAPLLITVLYIGLIDKEPDLGTAAVLFLAVLTQLYLAGVKKRHLLMIIGAAAIVGIFTIISHKHRIGRMTTFLNPESDQQGAGFQTIQSTRAVGSGSWFGMGWGHGRGKYYLPETDSDFIFATIAEELGFVGALPIIGLFMLIAYRGFMIAFQSKDRFASILAGGITSLFSFQALINIATATGSLPATGVPLPLISSGNSSLISTLIGIGILMSVSQHTTPPGQPVSTGDEKPTLRLKSTTERPATKRGRATA